MSHSWKGIVRLGRPRDRKCQKKMFYRTCEVEEIYFTDKSICSFLYQDRHYLKSSTSSNTLKMSVHLGHLLGNWPES